jgi:uncharacterized repeat protein (TIGR03803 family)
MFDAHSVYAHLSKITMFMKNKITMPNYAAVFSVLLALACIQQSSAQYVSPNQPGRAGGNTMPAPPELNQVVAATYYGTDGTFTGQGMLYAADKLTDTINGNGRAIHFFKGFASDASYSYYTSPFTASDGNIYGPSYYGGSNNLGAVYKYDVASSANSCTGNESIIYSNGGTGGSYGNYANLNEMSDGMLYLPETAGGPTVYGKLTKMNKNGSGATTVHNFAWGTLIDTNLYSAGAKMQPNFQTWKAFASDGGYPYGFPVEGPDGYIYGTTLLGGLGLAGAAYGTVYKVKKDGSDYKILAFGSTLSIGTYNTADGGTVTGTMPFANVWGNVAFDQLGEYAYFFGGYVAGQTFGNVCRVKLDGTAPVEVVHKFTFANGQDPYYLYRGPIIVNNELFGTTYFGGTGAYGTVWKLDLSKLNAAANPIDAAGKNNTLKIIHNFNFTNGAYPFAGLVYDGKFLYGSTQQGGYTGTSYGTVYRIKPDGTGFKSIMQFKTDGLPCPATTPANEKIYAAYYVSNERVTLANLTNTTCFSCIQNKCAAGSAPTLSTDTAANTCPSATVNLNSLISSTSTNPVKWYTNDTHTGTEYATPTAATPNTYYAFYFDATNNCYSGASGAVVVSATTCCAAGTTAPVFKQEP